MPAREFCWIARHFAPLAGPGGLGLTDDAALMAGLAVSVDTATEGVHFPPGLPPAAVARRALRCALSDLAAMGAVPAGYLLALSLPDGTDEAFVADFAAGLAADQKALGLRLLGGDTTATSGSLSVSVTVLGRVPSGAALRRSGACAGDRIGLSGAVGYAAKGLKDIQEGRTNTQAAQAFLLPQPQIALGRAGRGVAHAAIDISDGLVADIGHMARASGLRAVLDAGAIPACSDLPLTLAITAGDDYALALALPPGRGIKGFPLRDIGAFVEGPPGVEVRGADGRLLPLEREGWTHF